MTQKLPYYLKKVPLKELVEHCKDACEQLKILLEEEGFIYAATTEKWTKSKAV